MSRKRMLLAAFCFVVLCGVQAAERLWTGGVCQIAPDAEIEIDITGYTAKNAVTLLTCDSLQGRFDPANVTIIADKPALYGLEQTDKGLRLICNSGTLMIFR